MVETAKVNLVTVIAAFELEERLLRDLRGLGVKGYTIGSVDGRGVHGPRMAALVDAPNMRIEMLVGTALTQRILERIASKYTDQPIMAYVHAVDAMPREQFA
jgi:nitrogen regulatory protein P-II 2